MLLRFLLRLAVKYGYMILMDDPGDGIGHAPGAYRTTTHTLIPLAATFVLRRHKSRATVATVTGARATVAGM